MRFSLFMMLIIALPLRAEPLELAYEVRAGGVQLLDVSVRLEVSESGYRIDTTARTVGPAALFIRGTQSTLAEGAWRGALPLPSRYRADGVWRGNPRRVHLDFEAGRVVPAMIVPPNEAERETIEPALLVGAVDTLAGLARVSRLAAMEGHCSGEATTFDGRRVQAWRLVTEGQQRIRVADGGFDGMALRCGFEVRTVAGFRTADSREDQARPLIGTLWLGRVSPAAPPLPVRMEFATRWFGTARAELWRVGR